MKKLLVFLSILTFVCLTMIENSFSQGLELLAEIDSAKNVQAINVRDIAPNEIVFATETVGAYCGGGAPVKAWKIILDPDTGDVVSVTKKQDLSKIQNIRETLFESSNGNLFTGGGWCGYKPPYYSTDGGETWQSADAGPVHPPNSTYSFAEFNSDIYAGTGYEPYHGEVYRWLGNGNWEKVLETGSARNIVDSMAVYKDQLFVAAQLYGYVSCTGIPVYVSSDGDNFNATTGIDTCYNVQQLLIVNEQLVAWVNNRQPIPNNADYVYRWDGSSWEELGDFGLEGGCIWCEAAVSNDGVIYHYGHLSEDPSPGIYQSTDLGLTWQQIAEFQGPSVYTSHLHDNVLYIGTRSEKIDNIDKAYVYRLVLDTDGDGIPDDEDNCPESNLEETIIIDGCDSGAGNYLFDTGCTMSDLITECKDNAKNYGEFVSCVAHLTDDWKKDGLISGKEKGAIQSCAACTSDGLEFELEYRYPISEVIGGIGLSPDDSTLHVAYWTDTWSDKVEWYSTEAPYNFIDDVAYGRCHGDAVVSQNNQYIFTTTYYSGDVSRFDLWDANPQSTQIPLPTTSWPSTIALLPDRSKMVVLSGMDGRNYDMGNDALHIFNISSGNLSLLSTINLSDEPTGQKIAFFDNGAYGYFLTRRQWNSDPAKLQEISMSSLTITNWTNLPSEACSGIALADNTLYVADWDNPRILVYDRQTLTPIGEPWTLSSKAVVLAIPPDKSGLYALLPDEPNGGALEVLDLSSGDRIGGYEGLGGLSTRCDIEFNSDGSKVYISGAQGAGVLVLNVIRGAM